MDMLPKRIANGTNDPQCYLKVEIEDENIDLRLHGKSRGSNRQIVSAYEIGIYRVKEQLI